MKENFYEKKGIEIQNNTLSKELMNIEKSYREIEDLRDEDFANNTVLTKEMYIEIIKDTIKKKRLWNMLVSTVNSDIYKPPQNRKTQILDLCCSICEEKEMLSSYFGGEKFPYSSKNAVVTGIDTDKEAIELVGEISKGFENNFKFIIGDATNLDKYSDIPSKVDVSIIRHQQMFKKNYHNNQIETKIWKKIIEQGLNKITAEGIFIITSYTEEEHLNLLNYLNSEKYNVVIEKENAFSEPLGAGGIDKYIIVIKK